MTRKFEELERNMSPAAVARSDKIAQDMLRDMLLADIRKAAGITQTELAEALGIRQSAVSKLEKQENMQIGTLQRIIKTYGGKLEIIARLSHGDVRLSQFSHSGEESPQ